MIAPIVHFKNNRQPPLYGVINTDGMPVNLTGDSVTFYMRAVGASTPKVNGAAVVIDDALNGAVHYEWTAADVDTVDNYVGWWRVAVPGGQFEDTPEFLIQIVDHAPLGDEYVSAEELKVTRSIKDTNFDADVKLAVQASSRAIDGICGRGFSLGTAGEVRTYTPIGPDWVVIGDAVAVTNVSVDGTTLAAGTDYQLESPQLGWPYTLVRSLNGGSFTRDRVASVSVTGTFGWAVVPPEVKGCDHGAGRSPVPAATRGVDGRAGFRRDGDHARPNRLQHHAAAQPLHGRVARGVNISERSGRR